VFTLAKRFDDEGEGEEAEEEDMSFSKREKTLRKPLSRRKSRSISLRFLLRARSYSQGSLRLDVDRR
jgi:hypothetical protein